MIRRVNPLFAGLPPPWLGGVTGRDHLRVYGASGWNASVSDLSPDVTTPRQSTPRKPTEVLVQEIAVLVRAGHPIFDIFSQTHSVDPRTVLRRCLAHDFDTASVTVDEPRLLPGFRIGQRNVTNRPTGFVEDGVGFGSGPNAICWCSFMRLGQSNPEAGARMVTIPWWSKFQDRRRMGLGKIPRRLRMSVFLLLVLISAKDYAPTEIGPGLWRSPAGFVYRSDRRFTGDELRRQEAAAGFDVRLFQPGLRKKSEKRSGKGARSSAPYPLPAGRVLPSFDATAARAGLGRIDDLAACQVGSLPDPLAVRVRSAPSSWA